MIFNDIGKVEIREYSRTRKQAIKEAKKIAQLLQENGYHIEPHRYRGGDWTSFSILEAQKQ